MKKIITILVAVLMVLTLAGCSEKAAKVDPNEKSEGSMTYAEYVAASEDYADVQIEGFITNLAYSEAYGNINLFVQDGDGAYFVYRMPCTADDAAKLVVGQKVIIKGQKSAWAGEQEIAEGSATYEIVDATYTFDAVDLTDKFDDQTALDAYKNMLVTFTGLKVEADPMYNWDGSGVEGNDIYVSLTNGTTTYSWTVESDEFGSGTDVYEAVKNLKAGDTVDVTGFLYWYDAPQTHISAVTVK